MFYLETQKKIADSPDDTRQVSSNNCTLANCNHVSVFCTLTPPIGDPGRPLGGNPGSSWQLWDSLTKTKKEKVTLDLYSVLSGLASYPGVA